MAPQSETLAFEPTPALEHSKENYRHLNDEAMKAEPEYLAHHNHSKAVHFSDMPAPDGPVRRAQSIATTTVPLLPQVSSASQLPRQSQRTSTTVPEVDLNAYFENSRSLLDTLRVNHDRDKQAWNEERKLWNQERRMLQAKIADLEFKLNKSRDGGKRRYSNDSNTATLQAFRTDFSLASHAAIPGPRKPSHTRSEPAPVWEGPSQPHPPTRVFSNDSDQASNAPTNHLASISETEAATFPPLSQEVSPTTVNPLTKMESVPVPIGEIDSSLDGITLKSTALAPSFVARVRTPSANGSPAHSPSPRPRDGTSNGKLGLEINTLLSPLDEKLKRNAGHTPMNFDGAASTSLAGTETAPSQASTPTKSNELSPGREQPFDPAPSRQRPPFRPREDSDSYFGSTKDTKETLDEKRGEYRTEEVILEMHGEKRQVPNVRPNLETDDHQGSDVKLEREELVAQDDPALQHPLMLDPKGRKGFSHDFLDKVDRKLKEAADERDKDGDDSATNGPRNGDSNGKSEGESSNDKEIERDMPSLRMKKSTNFGSAYGSSKPGCL